MTDTTRTNPTIGDLIARRYSRRDALRGSASVAGVVVGGSLLAACGGGDDAGTSDPVPTVTATASPSTATTGTRVTITGTATDNGSITGTTFVQVAGPAVTLSATTGLTTSFIAPATAATTPVVIRFTATDNSANTASFDVSVVSNPAVLGFTAVAKSLADRVTVPAGYTVTTLAATGDPLASGVGAYSNAGTDADFASRLGDNGAGFVYFGVVAGTATGIDVSNSARGLLAMNHEGITQAYLHPAGPTAPGGVRPTAEVAKEIEAHGLSVFEVAANATNAWATVPASAYNRRVTPSTPVVFTGPVRATANLQTAFSTDGTTGRGTIGNSALSATNWGTAITSEEKWARYFRRPAAVDDARRTPKQLAALRRYGVTSDTGLYSWATAAAAGSQYARWDAQATGGSATADYRNEPNQFGWVLEVDPYDKAATVRKRTALGRLAHSGIVQYPPVATVKPVIYMADAGQNEYFYKFVSTAAYAAADSIATDRMAVGDKYLDAGTLYVARFAADGSGTWVPLTFATNGLDAANATFSFVDQADVLTHARIAGDILAATPMDRPAWTQINVTTGEILLALTGDSASVGATNVNAANPRAYVDAPSPEVGNRNGHIIRLRETGNLPDATTFAWDIFLFGSGADLDATNVNVSGLNDTNDFSGPEGLRFARVSNASGNGTPLLYVQTDDQAYRDVTNNQMLIALGAGSVGDNGTAAAKTITNGASTQATRVGLPITPTRLKRFLVGPVEAAVTGVDTTPDGRTMFVNIQHPGENGTATAPTSNWPANQNAAAPGARPRSATIVITRTDGGVVGL